MVRIRFPSPYGVTVIKSKIKFTFGETEYTFPSPYGVTVIKSNMEYSVLL